MVKGDLILDNILRTEIVSPKSDPAQSNPDRKTSRRDDTVRAHAAKIREKPAHACCEPDHLPAKTPDPAADNANPRYQTWGDPCRAELEDCADSPGNPDMK